MKPTQTVMYSGKIIDFNFISAADIDICDIAHNLSNICRFNGACPHFYSIAEHSFLISEFVPPRYELWALLHDAHEAYFGDITTPLANYLGREKISKLKSAIDQSIVSAFNITNTSNVLKTVKEWDERVTNAEGSLFFPNNWPSISFFPLKASKTLYPYIKYWTPQQAEMKFIARFQELTV